MDLVKRATFDSYIQEKFQCSGRQLYTTVTKLPEVERHRLWYKISLKTGLSERQILDFYHNTWGREFFRSPYEIQNEIMQLIHSTRKQISYEELKASVFDQVVLKYPDTFHREALREAVIRLIDKSQKCHKADERDFDDLLELFCKLE